MPRRTARRRGLHFPGKATILDTDTFDKYALLGYRKRARRRRTGGAPGAFWQGLALCLPKPMPAVPGSASCLPCIVGRAFTPAGEVGGGGRVRGGRNRLPYIAPVDGRQHRSGGRTSGPTAGRCRDRPLPRGRRPAVLGSTSRLPCIVGRAFTPAAGPCGRARFPGRCQHRPLRTRGKVLPGFTGYFRRQPAMHPSVCALRRSHLPLQGRLLGAV